jgi:hypothetical protein
MNFAQPSIQGRPRSVITHCKECKYEVGEFDNEFGHNRGQLQDGLLYYGMFNGKRETSKGEHKRKKKSTGFTG